jgi:hypothetical protein
MITQSELQNKFNYDPDTGIFTRKYTYNKFLEGSQVGCKDSEGYLIISLTDRCYKAHRLAWLYVYGEFPKYNLDHINGNPSDNRISNLREANESQNGFNRKLNSNNTSGHKGVTFDKKSKKWQAYVTVNKKLKYLGQFESLELAALVAKEARIKYHGEFARNE